MARKARRDEALASATDRSLKAQTEAPTTASEHNIGLRAYELYLARGREHGHDLDDWLQAERELSERRVSGA